MKDLILLHGALGAASQFDALKKVLADTFTVHSFNFSGHGGSPIGADFSIQTFTQELDQWIEEHSLVKPNIFGYSMGGYVALNYALQNPDSVGSIVTLATKFDWSPESAAKEAKMLNPLKIKEKVPKFAQQLSERHGQEHWEQLVEQTAQMMLALGTSPLLTSQSFKSIGNQCLTAIGDRDIMVSREETITVFKTLINSQLLILPNTPHPLEKVSLDRLVFELKSFFLSQSE